MEHCEKRRSSSVPGMLQFLALALFCGVLIVGCANSAQSKFENKLDKLFDSLIGELKAYAAGDTSEKVTGTSTWYESDHFMMNPHVSMSVDRSLIIISTARAIRDQFSQVSLEFLSQDPKELDDWAASFRKRYGARRAEVGRLLDKIKVRYRSNPHDYDSSMFGPTLGISPNGHLYFLQETTGYYIDAMIDVDFDKWLAAVKEKMRELKKNKSPSGIPVDK